MPIRHVIVAHLVRLVPLALGFALLSCSGLPGGAAEPRSFTLAVIPDTQNYIDFRHQTAAGFVLDGKSMFLAQMQYVADHAIGNGGDIVFVASVGDVWQHHTKRIDPEHEARGMRVEPDPILARNAVRKHEVLTIELPTAIEGYRIISRAGLPFGVAPGNHDYDAAWSVAGYPPNRKKSWAELTLTVEDVGMLHYGGLDNFRNVFGDDTPFFKDKPWYVASFRGGANSAQVFRGAGYKFLHIALEMQPDDDVLAWVRRVLKDHPSLPTIVTTHDYLNARGERRPQPVVDLARIEPDRHNSAEQLWDKLLRRHDQIFLVLSGHQIGQAMRVDANDFGNPVYQVLADYQDRGQAGRDAGARRHVGLGDGWLRLMRFDFATDPATISVKTYSSHYRAFSGDLAQYADWYRHREQPQMSDTGFRAADDFVIRLDGFTRRFEPAHRSAVRPLAAPSLGSR